MQDDVQVTSPITHLHIHYSNFSQGDMSLGPPTTIVLHYRITRPRVQDE